MLRKHSSFHTLRGNKANLSSVICGLYLMPTSGRCRGPNFFLSGFFDIWLSCQARPFQTYSGENKAALCHQTCQPTCCTTHRWSQPSAERPSGPWATGRRCSGETPASSTSSAAARDTKWRQRKLSELFFRTCIPGSATWLRPIHFKLNRIGAARTSCRTSP